jgi:hypothetical protein
MPLQRLVNSLADDGRHRDPSLRRDASKAPSRFRIECDRGALHAIMLSLVMALDRTSLISKSGGSGPTISATRERGASMAGATEPRPGNTTEEFRISGDELVAKVKDLVREGNIRRLIIRNDQGTTLIEIPLTVGLVGVALLPVWAAVGAIAALATDCSIVVERRD